MNIVSKIVIPVKTGIQNMYLLIDPSGHDKIHLALFNEKTIEHKTYSGRNREILGCINKLFNDPHLTSPLIRGRKTSHLPPFNKGGRGGILAGIMVVVGVGGFTSTRVACVIANTFAYVLQIPLLAIKHNEIEKVQKLIPKLLKQKPGHYLSATYSAEPNIGKK